MMQVPVMEIFGPTIQGEGMVIGQKTMFVRTAGCDYSCSWCDSKFTWDGSEKDQITMMNAEAIIDELDRIAAGRYQHVTISGGNPGLLKHLGTLVEQLHKRNIKVALETQGSKWQDWFLDIDELTLSPKPPSSLMKTDFHVLDTIIRRLEEQQRGSFSIKVVIFNEEDLTYATELHKKYPTVDWYLQVGNDDIETTDDTKLVQYLLRKYEALIDTVMESNELNNVKVLPQLHTYLWGNLRGV